MIYRDACDIVLDDVFVELRNFVPQSHVFLKLEGVNPAGSIKTKTALALVDAAEESGALSPGGRVIESSSGNLGVALSMVCAIRGYELTVVSDANANRTTIDEMRALGTRVILIDEPDEAGGFLDRRLELIHRELAADPKLVWLNQYANPANVRAHRDRTAAAIHVALGRLDVLVVGVGTAGTLMGCVEYRRLHGTPARIVACDAQGSVTFGEPPARRWIPGVGASRRPEIFRDTGEFEKVIVSEREAVEVCRSVARGHGLLVGGSTGTALAATLRVGLTVPPGSRIAVISPDFGHRYLDTVYSDRWVEERFASDAVAEVTA